jgi:hypothetical protein
MKKYKSKKATAMKKNCTSFSLEMKSVNRASDSTPSFSLEKKAVSSPSMAVNQPRGFES